MKLIALAIFLLSISSNAFAKVEIWECDNSTWYKIDTRNDIPRIYERKDYKWQKLYELNYVEYKKDEGTIWIYLNADSIIVDEVVKTMEVLAVYDLVTRSKVMLPYEYLKNLEYSCRVRE